MGAVKLQISLDNLIKFLSPFRDLVNCHMVSYLTDNHWSTLIPTTIQHEINCPAVDQKDFLNYLWSGNYINASYPELNQFLAKLQAQRDENFNSNCLELDELLKQLEILNFPNNNDLKLQIKEFMSDKKCHEVEVTSSVIANLCKKYDNKLFVVDAGDGKGYLSSRLALQYDLKVLGIDANCQNTESAQKRISKLSKAWNALTKRAEEINNGMVPPKRGRRKKSSFEVVPAANRDNYRTSTEFITSTTDFYALIKSNFPDANPDKCILSGLHTCGNLAADCLKIFVENRDMVIVTNIGCCYHLLNEEFTVDKFYKDRIKDKISSVATEDVGFPLSTYLKNKSYCIGRNARMLGLQSIYRVNSTKELPNKTLFYRALLEVLIVEKNPDLANIIQVGKIKCENFQEYVAKCLSKNNLEVDCSREKLEALENKYEMSKFLLNCFYLLRMQFASIIESIILLDRILYLHENDIEHVFLTRLFDPVISPRCYGIIGIKSK